jgi:hypothetical protein
LSATAGLSPSPQPQPAAPPLISANASTTLVDGIAITTGMRKKQGRPVNAVVQHWGYTSLKKTTVPSAVFVLVSPRVDTTSPALALAPYALLPLQ